MNARKCIGPLIAAAFLGVAVSLCVSAVSRGAKAAPDDTAAPRAATRAAEPVDCDFTQMNSTMRMAHVFRLGANPQEFADKTLRVAGVFLTQVDRTDGKRRFGCLLCEPGGCTCCAPGGVLEFEPKDSYAWPADFPSAESRITVTGRLKMVEAGDEQQPCSVPRLLDADIVPGG